MTKYKIKVEVLHGETFEGHSHSEHIIEEIEAENTKEAIAIFKKQDRLTFFAESFDADGCTVDCEIIRHEFKEN